LAAGAGVCTLGVVGRGHVALALALALALVAGCVRSPTYTGARQTSGTCEGACRHYVACKGTREPAVENACVFECQEIFVEDGVADAETLRDYERLACPDAVSFVEGDSGEGPGQASGKEAAKAADAPGRPVTP
jgi:hypothetical protein